MSFIFSLFFIILICPLNTHVSEIRARYMQARLVLTPSTLPIHRYTLDANIRHSLYTNLMCYYFKNVSVTILYFFYNYTLIYNPFQYLPSPFCILKINFEILLTVNECNLNISWLLFFHADMIPTIMNSL